MTRESCDLALLTIARRTIVVQQIEINRLHLMIDQLKRQLVDEKKDAEKKLEIAEQMATRDMLTGLLNKRGGEEVLSRHFSIICRNNCEKNNFAVLYLDLDDFKNINDTYGHDVGDEVLRFFAKRIIGVLRRKYDVVMRTGGDEFIIVLPGCDSDQAEIVKTKIKKVLAEKLFIFENVKLSIRTSIGIAMALDNKGSVIPLEKILVQADKAMYNDKKEGKASRRRHI